jgi:hypothetical protein
MDGRDPPSVYAAAVRRGTSPMPGKRRAPGDSSPGAPMWHVPEGVRPLYACAALIMSNIGRYMATTIPPITTPMITIMIGSRIEVSAVTAASTSSS